MASVQDIQGRLAQFPVSFFSITLGLGGWAIATQKLEQWWHLPAGMSVLCLALDILVFVVLVAFYGAKIIAHGPEVTRELNHPVKLNFFPTLSIGLLLMSIAFLELHPEVSLGLWILGTASHLLLTLYILKDWICQEHYEIHHMNPAWFIPVVGNILVPIAGIGHAPLELSWFFFAVGIVMWIVMFVIVIYRMIFHRPLPDRLLPTLFILLAPPAVGFIAYVKLTDTLDPFSRILYYFTLFMLLVLLSLFGKFRKISFYLSWWAYSFPVAALTIASQLMGRMTGSVFYMGLAGLLWCLLSALIIYLSWKTILSIRRKAICIEE